VELVIAVEEKFNLTISGTEQFISRWWFCQNTFCSRYDSNVL
jgi:hypothetical protein